VKQQRKGYYLAKRLAYDLYTPTTQLHHLGSNSLICSLCRWPAHEVPCDGRYCKAFMVVSRRRTKPGGRSRMHAATDALAEPHSTGSSPDTAYLLLPLNSFGDELRDDAPLNPSMRLSGGHVRRRDCGEIALVCCIAPSEAHDVQLAQPARCVHGNMEWLWLYGSVASDNIAPC
jgi:hypothetical protein